MKRLSMSFLCLFLVLLASCAPVATVAEQDDAALHFVTLPNGNLAVVANTPVDYGDVRVTGEALVIKSPFCATQDCLPNERKFVRLTFPDEENKSYGKKLELEVVSGKPTKGRALMTLAGEDVSREALLSP